MWRYILLIMLVSGFVVFNALMINGPLSVSREDIVSYSTTTIQNQIIAVSTITKERTKDYCGNDKIDLGETSKNCCVDIGCAEDYECKDNKCVKKNCINIGDINNPNKCLVVFDNKVYDLTNSKEWSLSGHEGQHYCGEIYDAKTIDKGPHDKKAESLMRRYFLKELC